MFCVLLKNSPLDNGNSAGKKAKSLCFAARLFIKCDARLRGQHINSYSRLIHMLIIVNKISPSAVHKPAPAPTL